MTPGVLEEMRRLRAEDMFYERIARRFGVYSMTVYSHLRKEGRSGLIGKLKRKLGLGWPK